MGVVSAYRYEGNEINESIAELEANIVHNEIKGKAFKTEEIIRVLSTRSKPQLKATFNRYRDIHATSITKVHQYKILNFTYELSLFGNVFVYCLLFFVSCFFLYKKLKLCLGLFSFFRSFIRSFFFPKK